MIATSFLAGSRPSPRALVLSACLAALVPACKKGAAGPAVGPASDTRTGPVRVHTAVGTARTIPETLALTGTLVAEQQSELTALVQGRVEAVLVERGATVRAGDPILRIRAADYQAAADNARAVLSQARARIGLSEDNAAFHPEQMAEVQAAHANMDAAEDALRRVEQMLASHAVSDQDVARARAQAQGAREQYRAALNGARGGFFAYRQAQVGAAQAARNLNDTLVRAPFEGEIAERRVNVGEFVTPQRGVVLLVQTSHLRVELQVPQDKVRYLRPGQRVLLRADGFPDRRFDGTVRYISAAVRPDSRALVAEALVPNPDGVLRPGMFVTASVALGNEIPVVAVPSNAILTEAGTSRAFVVRDGRIDERVVTLQERRGDEIWVARGLAGGEKVATDALERLSDGTAVTE